MIIIEVCGYRDMDVDDWATFMRCLGKIFSGASYRGRIRVIQTDSRVQSLDSQSTRFLRLRYTHDEERSLFLSDVVDRLKDMKMGIAVHHPAFDYYPAKSKPMLTTIVADTKLGV